MDSSDSWRARLDSALGPAESVRPLGGGAWRVTTGDRQLVVKTGPGVLDEAAGLRQLADVRGAPPVPDVVHVEAGLLVTTWVDQGMRTAEQEETLGRMLGHLHSAAWPAWGGGSSWIGACRVDGSVVEEGAGFYGGRLLELAGRCGLTASVAGVASRLPGLLPEGGPALVHGDLWWGNVLWGADGQPWLIDPSVHGGHPEEDLAMLALFGQVPDRLLSAYTAVRQLEAGWEERVALFQLYPLLVHAVLFGGGYGARAEEVARRFS